MKTITLICTVGVLLLAGQAMAARVSTIDLGYQDGSTVVRVAVDGQVRFTHSTEIPKNGRPDRIIVDILSATHDLGAKEYLELPPCAVTGLRTSQYAVTPEKVVRIVLDLTAAPIYRVDSDETSISIVIDDKNTKPFAAWSTSGPATPAPKAAQPKPVAAAPKTASVSDKNTAIEQDRKASLAATTPPPTSAPAAAKPVTVEPKPAAPEAAKPVIAESKPVLPETAKPTSEPVAKPAAKPTAKPAPVVAKAAEAPADMPLASSMPEWFLAAQPKAPQPVADEAKPSAVEKPQVIPTPAVVATEPIPVQQPAVPAPTPLVAQSDKPADKPMPAPQKAEPQPQPVMPPASPVAAESAVTVNPQTVELLPESVVPEDTMPALPPAIGEAQPETVLAEQAADSEDSAADRKTSRFRRSAAVSAKVKGTMVAEFPARLVIQYASEGYRDPFQTLLDDSRTYNDPVERRVPNVEGLRLVGVIESATTENRALFEDKEGYSYILKSGDQVRNGYVLRVEADRVYFQIFEYGWSRTVALQMQE